MTSATITDRSLKTLWNNTVETLSLFGATPIPVDPQFSFATGGNGRFTLRSYRACLDSNHADCRIVLTQGTSSEIINTLIYPKDPSTLPVFAAEIVVVNSAPRMLFVDHLLPDVTIGTQSHVHRITSRCIEPYLDLASVEPAPFWATKYSSEGHLYCRPHPPEVMPRILSAYHDYLAAWMDLAHSENRDKTSKAEWNETADFKHMQATQSPGLDYLNKLFGAAWTHRFINEFLHR